MAGGNFVHRVMSYVVNELIVSSLANRWLRYVELAGGISPFPISLLPEAKQSQNFKDVLADSTIITCSPAFQRFAVRTSRKIEDISKIAEKKKQELAEQVKDISKNLEQSFKG